MEFKAIQVTGFFQTSRTCSKNGLVVFRESRFSGKEISYRELQLLRRTSGAFFFRRVSCSGDWGMRSGSCTGNGRRCLILDLRGREIEKLAPEAAVSMKTGKQRGRRMVSALLCFDRAARAQNGGPGRRFLGTSVGETNRATTNATRFIQSLHALLYLHLSARSSPPLSSQLSLCLFPTAWNRRVCTSFRSDKRRLVSPNRVPRG